MASNLGWLTFTFDFMKRIEPLLEGQWEVQRVRQVHICSGTLAHWHTGTLAHWHTGTLSHTSILTLPQRHVALAHSPHAQVGSMISSGGRKEVSYLLMMSLKMEVGKEGHPYLRLSSSVR